MNENRVKNDKPYYNIMLANRIKGILNRKVYGDFAIILEDIFQRRAYEFGFSDREIVEQARNFIANVKSIEFAPSTDKAFDGTAMGVYCLSEKKIKINQDYYLGQEKRDASVVEFGEKIYETLTHEVYHAIGDYYHANKNRGLAFYNNATKNWGGNALDEVFIETAADRATISRNARDVEKGRRDTSGYGTITFATNLLAASVGVTEKEVLKAGLQNRGKLMELFDSKFPTFDHIEGFYSTLFKTFEANLEVIYNIEYKDKENKNPKEYQMKRDMLKGALAGLYRSSYDIASFQIASDERHVGRALLGEVEHRFAKMERIMNDTMNAFAYRYNFSTKEVDEIYSDISEMRTSVASKLVGIDLILKQGHKITDQTERMLQADKAKRSLLFDGENIGRLQERYGIDLPNGIGYKEALKITADFEYVSYMLKEDFDNGMQWDNEAVAIVLNKMFSKHMEDIGIITRFSPNNKFAEMDTEELPTVDDGSSITAELPVIDPDKTEEMPIVEGVNEENKGLFSKIGKRIKNFITQLKNKNQKQLPEHSQPLSIEEKTEYYANLVTNSQRLESTLDKYIVDSNSINHSAFNRKNEPKVNEIDREDRE